MLAHNEPYSFTSVLEKTAKALDGTTHEIIKEVLREARTPTLKGHQDGQEMTLKLAKLQDSAPVE